MTLSHVKIVGSGLIGTSIGLGLALKGVGITMSDSDSRAQALAEDLVKSPSTAPIDLVIFATPIGALSSILNDEFATNPNSPIPCQSVLFDRILHYSSIEEKYGYWWNGASASCVGQNYIEYLR